MHVLIALQGVFVVIFRCQLMKNLVKTLVVHVGYYQQINGEVRVARDARLQDIASLEPASTR